MPMSYPAYVRNLLYCFSLKQDYQELPGYISWEMAPTCLDNNGVQTGRLDVERVLPLGGRIPSFLYGSLGLEPCEEVSLKGTSVEF